MQATETLKLILKKGKPLIGRFLIYSALEADFRTIVVGKKPNCPLCGPEPTITTLSDCYEGAAAACGTPPALIWKPPLWGFPDRNKAQFIALLSTRSKTRGSAGRFPVAPCHPRVAEERG